MAIESLCTGCGKRLRVGDEHAGKAARRPACGNIYTVPAASTTGAASAQEAIGSGDQARAAPEVQESWFMQTPEQSVLCLIGLVFMLFLFFIALAADM